MMNILFAWQEADKIRGLAQKVLEDSSYYDYDNLSGLRVDYMDEEQLFLLDELRGIMDKLAEVNDRLVYLASPVTEISYLHKNQSGRYETAQGHEYTSGCSIEALVRGCDRAVPFWTRTRMEHDGRGYYLVGYRDTLLDGLLVRVRG